ncbi:MULTISPECIES: C40 family peptidase [Streptomyces]|uniref:C40 family peptidase n=1 Tax=Streptomyces TaxID=1883 RepID=UPI0022487709|nr:C40 family peptidase [Streptomyces sp. JHD 1]MCX2969360.1 NlpC/P60 family protein [Streptomyces sp. JHD 1]
MIRRGRARTALCVLGVLGLLAVPGPAHADPAPAPGAPGTPAASAPPATPAAPAPSAEAEPTGEPAPPDAFRGAPSDGAPAAPSDPAAPPAPGPEGGAPSAAADLEAVRQRIEDLHDEAGSATDAYNAAVGRVAEQEEAVADLDRRIERNEESLRTLRDQAGAMARAQYRGGGLPAGARLALGDDPERFLHSLSLFHKGQRAALGVLGDLDRVGAELGDDAEEAARTMAALEATRTRRAEARERIEARLEEARALESELAADERERLRELEERTARQRQLRWLRTGVLDEIGDRASEAGQRAIAYATQQLGKDYEWGAEGPDTFDCSGLTQRAWEAAGRAIPRTSQEQWRRLPRVAVADMRPGDLIVYKEDASHVGLYIGDGEMVHAPRTGRQIRVEGAGALPILGVVRPDA